MRQYMANERQRRQAEEQLAGDGHNGDVDSAAEEMDSDDEEIVFVGRNGRMRDMQQKRAAAAAAQYRMAHREVSQETVDSGLLFDSFGDDETAAFKSVEPSPPCFIFFCYTLCASETKLTECFYLDDGLRMPLQITTASHPDPLPWPTPKESSTLA